MPFVGGNSQINGGVYAAYTSKIAAQFQKDMNLPPDTAEKHIAEAMHDLGLFSALLLVGTIIFVLILMTTNCVIPPKGKYKDRLWTTGATGVEGCRHIDGAYGEKKDFSGIIEQAKTCEPPKEIESGKIVGGFAHEQVFALADKVVDAIKSGAIKKFIVMAGCDGHQKSRNYYTEFAEKLPKDTVILTAGCAKYKYNKLPLGDIGGIPRVLDAGQCNDSYSLALIALKLKEVFGLDDVNQLPLAYNIAWYEQKAVIVLLALLYLGVKNIHLGPTLPAFLSPNVANVLVENFGISGIGTVEDDMKMFFEE